MKKGKENNRGMDIKLSYKLNNAAHKELNKTQFFKMN